MARIRSWLTAQIPGACGRTSSLVTRRGPKSGRAEVIDREILACLAVTVPFSCYRRPSREIHMRVHRVLFTWLLLAGIVIGSLGLPGALSASTGSPGLQDNELARFQDGDAQELSGSVVVRSTTEVSAASVDFEAYAANRYIVRF